MPGARPLLFVMSSLLAASTTTAQPLSADAAPAVDRARYALEARVEPPEMRFALLDAEISASKTSAGPRFVLLAPTAKGATLCTIGDALFADGFED